jgi:hypothetical protein
VFILRVFLIAAAIGAMAAPAAAQTDEIVGDWIHPGFIALTGFHEEYDERFPGPEVGEYLGIPLNEAGRLRADSWSGSLLTVPEHQCMPHPSMYAMRGPLQGQLRIAKRFEQESQAVIAYTVDGTFRRADRVIWMDGRPHPPEYAAHTWAGFSTGRWEGTHLRVETTHMKAGWIRRNGVSTSDAATMVEYFSRHGNYLTVSTIVVDPIYLTEPYVKSSDFALVKAPVVNGAAWNRCFPAVEIATMEPHAVPHYLPGTNPYLTEAAERWQIPVDAMRGGAETAYPEYARTLKTLTTPPRRPRPGNSSR